MNLTGRLPLTILILIIFTSSVEAQILNRLKQRAQDRVERKVEEKIDNKLNQTADRMVDNAWDSIFGEAAENDKDGRRSIPFTLNSNVPTEDAYHFDIVTTMEIETESDGKKEPPVLMQMHFNENEMYTGTRYLGESVNSDDGDVFLIYDLKNSAMIMLMSSEDGKFSFAYDWAKTEAMIEEMEKAGDPDEDSGTDTGDTEFQGYEKIGQKDIMGYRCDGYRSTADNTVTEIWVTREAAYGMETMFQANANSKQMRGKIPDDYPYGMMMEMISVDPESDEKVIMKVTDIKKNAQVTYRMNDYPNIGMAMQEKD
ncbi:MAG: DUF4412 domain-containing protein [Cyclonatronaceae bacterium]